MLYEPVTVAGGRDLQAGGHGPADCSSCLCLDCAGVYTNNYDPTLNARNGFPVFSTLVEANHVAKTEDLFAAYKLTDEDKHDIHKLARDPRIGASQDSNPVADTAFCAALNDAQDHRAACSGLLLP